MVRLGHTLRAGDKRPDAKRACRVTHECTKAAMTTCEIIEHIIPRKGFCARDVIVTLADYGITRLGSRLQSHKLLGYRLPRFLPAIEHCRWGYLLQAQKPRFQGRGLYSPQLMDLEHR